MSVDRRVERSSGQRTIERTVEGSNKPAARRASDRASPQSVGFRHTDSTTTTLAPSCCPAGRRRRRRRRRRLLLRKRRRRRRRRTARPRSIPSTLALALAHSVPRASVGRSSVRPRSRLLAWLPAASGLRCLLGARPRKGGRKRRKENERSSEASVVLPPPPQPLECRPEKRGKESERAGERAGERARKRRVPAGRTDGQCEYNSSKEPTSRTKRSA